MKNHRKKNHRRNGARLLGLLVVAALGAMALASSAQAVLPVFLIATKPAALLATVNAEQEGRGTMLVPGLKFELNCEKFSVDEGAIETSEDAKAILLYTECSTLEYDPLNPAKLGEIKCHVKEPIKAEALLLPAELTKKDPKGILLPAILAEKIKALVQLSDSEITAQWPLGSLPCILPEDNTVTGEVCLWVTEATNDKVKPLVETNSGIECKERKVLEGLNDEVLSGGFKDKLKYGAQEVTLDGKAILELTGVHKGLTLGVSLF